MQQQPADAQTCRFKFRDLWTLKYIHRYTEQCRFFFHPENPIRHTYMTQLANQAKFCGKVCVSVILYFVKTYKLFKTFKGLFKISQIGNCVGIHIITLDILHIKISGIFRSTWGWWSTVEPSMFDSLIFFTFKIYLCWLTPFFIHLVLRKTKLKVCSVFFLSLKKF